MSEVPRIVGCRAQCLVLPFLAALLAACGDDGQGHAPGPEKPASTVADCANAGDLHCDVKATADLAQTCDALRACLVGRRVDGETIKAITGCSDTRQSVAGDTQHLAAAIVSTDLEVDGPPSHGAFLLINGPAGWCPADTVHPPVWNQGGVCRVEASLDWRSHAGAQSELAIQSERVCHMALGQEELATGESDVVFVECRRASYLVDATGAHRVSQALGDGPCKQ